MSNGWKLFLMAASGLITCIVISTGILLARQADDIGAMASETMTSFQTSVEEQKILQYDGATVTGSDVMNLIKSTLGGYSEDEQADITITVITSSATTEYCNNSLNEEMAEYGHSAYISPMAEFCGAVLRNENDVITDICFEQQ